MPAALSTLDPALVSIVRAGARQHQNRAKSGPESETPGDATQQKAKTSRWACHWTRVDRPLQSVVSMPGPAPGGSVAGRDPLDLVDGENEIFVVVANLTSIEWVATKTTTVSLRAHPGSLDSWRGICSKSPEHDADHGEADECSNGRCVAFEVASQATVTTDPRERSFDDPPFRQHLKSSSVRSLDDLQAPGTSAPHRHRHLASRVSAVGKNAFDERE